MDQHEQRLLAAGDQDHHRYDHPNLPIGHGEGDGDQNHPDGFGNRPGGAPRVNGR